MPPQRTRTIKNKHAAPKSGSSGSGSGGAKNSGSLGKQTAKRPPSSSAKRSKPKGPVVSQQLKERGGAGLYKRPKKKVYTEKELGIPALNMITPVGVEKPRGQKKGKVFVDDKESMTTILSLVQAEKEGHIESKMIKARQLEEIREARKAEADKKAEEKKAKLEDTKDALRKKRKRTSSTRGGEGESLKSISQTGTRGGRVPRKKVSFA